MTTVNGTEHGAANGNGAEAQAALKIILADDGSQHSLAAIALLRDLPLPPGSGVTALAVLTPRESGNRSVLEAVLKQTRAMLAEHGLAVDTELGLGYPPEKLVEWGEKLAPDLIVLGAKGLRATLGILLGGVAQQVVEYARWPVLVVRTPYTGLRRVLLVTDGSPYSQRALSFLRRLPLPEAVELRVLHVLPPLSSSDLIVQTRWTDPEMLPHMAIHNVEDLVARQADEECEGQALLDRSLKALKGKGQRVTSVLLRGDAATEILEYIKDNAIDLVVAGSRGLSPMRGWLLGSVSRKLVHYANCSVLVVKGS